jgi:hypothetical protein
MGRSKLDQEKRKRNGGKLVTMPDKTGDAEVQEAGRGGEGAGKKAPRKGGKQALKNEAEEEEHKGAKKALRLALKAKVKEERTEIAAALVRKIKEGDLGGAKVALVLMERGKKEGKDGKKKRSGPSEVELLASEPQWDEEMDRLVKQVTEMQGTACNMR